jgi:hypothetical protein
MTYTGHVEKGVVVFDGPVRPPEGAAVRVEEVETEQASGVGDGLDRLAGRAKGLPADLAERHDHYRRERRVS